MTSNHIIEIEQLKREFVMGSEVVSAKRASFQVKQSEFLTIMGTSGSGKTTTFWMP